MIICLNNKCNLNKEEFRKYQEELSSRNTNHEIILCPTHLNISEMNLETVKLGAQNVSSFSGGPHTGEVSADMLKSYQVQYCIIGHSERRENNKETLEDINEKMIAENLYTNYMPDPDLLIRTSGEIRTSNFMPWQIVYSEYLFVEKLWPDFEESDLDDAIKEYQKRNRKFGAK